MQKGVKRQNYLNINKYIIYMPFITFIYKVGKNYNTYYGKYCFDYISDDHEGLDNEVKDVLIKGLNEYRKKNNIQKLKSKIIICILSVDLLSDEFLLGDVDKHEFINLYNNSTKDYKFLAINCNSVKDNDDNHY